MNWALKDRLFFLWDHFVIRGPANFE
jgi:hypothetical protein